MKVYIGESRIPGAGRGLFALKDIKRGERIVEVTGPRMTVAEIEAQEVDSHYLLELNDGTGDCIEVCGEARYANDAKGLNGIPGLINNAQFCSDEDHAMYMEATRSIKTGQEVLVNYGKGYWTALRDNLRLAASASILQAIALEE